MGFEDEKRKCNLLLHYMRAKGLDIFNTFEINSGEAEKLEKIIEKFDGYYQPKANVTYERYKFFSRNQKVGENFEHYVTELKSLSATYEFEKLRDSLIKDKIISGIENNKLREMLLQETNLTLNKCIEICRAETRIREVASETITVHEIQKKLQHKESTRSIKKCSRCGGTHSVNKCPAYGKICKNCQKMNHFAKVCKSKQIKKVTRASRSEENEENSTLEDDI